MNENLSLFRKLLFKTDRIKNIKMTNYNDGHNNKKTALPLLAPAPRDVPIRCSLQIIAGLEMAIAILFIAACLSVLFFSHNHILKEYHIFKGEKLQAEPSITNISALNLKTIPYFKLEYDFKTTDDKVIRGISYTKADTLNFIKLNITYLPDDPSISCIKTLSLHFPSLSSPFKEDCAWSSLKSQQVFEGKNTTGDFVALNKIENGFSCSYTFTGEINKIYEGTSFTEKPGNYELKGKVEYLKRKPSMSRIEGMTMIITREPFTFCVLILQSLFLLAGIVMLIFFIRYQIRNHKLIKYGKIGMAILKEIPSDRSYKKAYIFDLTTEEEICYNKVAVDPPSNPSLFKTGGNYPLLYDQENPLMAIIFDDIARFLDKDGKFHSNHSWKSMLPLIAISITTCYIFFIIGSFFYYIFL